VAVILRAVFKRSAIFTSTISAPLLFAAVVCGQTSSIEGDVKGVDGRVASSAEVKIERQDRKAAPRIIKTDARGRFVANSLPAAAYNVTARVAGGITSPVQAIIVHADRPVMLSFDLREPAGGKKTTSLKKKKKYVWVPAETGTHLGGRYVEVEDDSDAVPGTLNVQKGSSNMLRRIQSSGTNNPNGN
jgi:hypothetical protein